ADTSLTASCTSSASMMENPTSGAGPVANGSGAVCGVPSHALTTVGSPSTAIVAPAVGAPRRQRAARDAVPRRGRSNPLLLRTQGIRTASVLIEAARPEEDGSGAP